MLWNAMLLWRLYLFWHSALGADLAVAADASLLGMAPFAGAAPPGKGLHLKVVSWNVAAVNNNPFEYWITHPDPRYKQLMQSVEQFIVDPADEEASS